MHLLEQILWGSLFMGICLGLEVILLVACTLFIRRRSERWEALSVALRHGLPMTVALAYVVLAHTLQVWIWASAFIHFDVLPDWNTSLYFSMVTYTTLGYGDVVVGEQIRIFGTFASVAGLLAFGLSTAYLVALMGQILQDDEVLEHRRK